MSRYYLVDVLCKPDVSESLQAILFAFDCDGTEQSEQGFFAYFSDKTFDEEKVTNLFTNLAEHHEFSFTVQCFQEQNWNAKWESDYQPIFVGDYCAIYAPFHQPQGRFKHELIINPQMAFGTGHHETTQMMLEQMKTINFSDLTVLDLGSGTGILAIVAKKEGAKAITAVDIDENAFTIMKDNFVVNEAASIQAIFGTVEQVEGQFDLILANINRNVLLAEAEKICAHLNEKGRLIISGFFTKDAELLNAHFQPFGLHETRRIEKNNWCSIIFRK